MRFSGGPLRLGVPFRCRMADHDADRAPALVRALDVATSGVLVCDATSTAPTITYVNGAFERLFDRTAAELVGMAVTQLVGEAIEDPAARHALAAALRDETPHEATFTLRRRDGSTFRAEMRITPVHDGAGDAATDWIAVIDDVTERLDARDQLALAEARYRTLVEHVPAVAYVADWDERSTLAYISPQIEDLLGWPPEAFIEDQDLWYRCIHPADLDRVVAAERASFAAGIRVDIEFRMTARDGREVWVRDKETVVRDADGAPRFSQGVLVDVTPTRETESELADERHRAQRYLDIAGAIIVILDADARITLLNRAGAELLGYDEGELIGRDWYEAVVPQRLQEAGRALYVEELQAEEDDAVHESVVVTKSGEERTIAWRDTIVRNADGHVNAMMSSGVDLTERRAAEEQIAYLAYHDPLTGLPNRALLQEHLDLALARARRESHAVGLLYLDLDGFKLVNDSLGHPAGDELLCHVTMRLAERRRGSDLLARQGGDEFLLLLAGLDRQDAEQHARGVADDLLAALAEPFSISGAEFHIGASIGISLYPRDAADADELLRHADAAMYAAKAAGRNTVTVYNGDPHEPLERLSMTSRLRKALDREELILHWQPIVDPRDGTLRKLEALVRWQDPFRGLVMPDDFIAFAEETGFVDRVGDWVVGAARDQILAWERDGYKPPRVTVNVSPRQLRRPDFGARLLGLVLPDDVASRFTVEITESAAMADPLRTDPVLHDLVAAGVEIAVDDFGAGYSSLSRLRTLPVQVLKIDKTFLQAVPHDVQATAIVTAIIELARALGMEAVAEGVENEDQRAFLVERGCPLAQGYLLGRPAPAGEIEPLLERVEASRPS
jgi:diguanylate cyclase (GGDEF)-like protein/PAS domain S-box-containing protein